MTMQCVHIPTAGRVVSAFGVRASRQHPGETRMHNGWDIPAPMGQTVHAIADGVVTHVTDNGAPGFANYGRVVVIRHEQFTPRVWSLYAHLSGTMVAPEMTVRAGQPIGMVGNTDGESVDGVPNGHTFPAARAHLHFEIAPRAYPMRHEDSRFDPVVWFAQNGITYQDGRPDSPETCDIEFSDPAQPAWWARPQTPGQSRGRAIAAVFGLGLLAVALGKRR